MSKNHFILRRMTIHFVGILVSSIAIIAISGQLLDAPFLYDWGGHGGLSIPTAVCFLLIGIGFLIGDEDGWN